MITDRQKAARELLTFYVEAGVESLVGEVPVDRLSDPAPIGGVEDAAGSAPEESPAPPPATKPPLRVSGALKPPERTAPPPTTAAPEVSVMAAREAARSARTLDELRTIVEAFEGCALKYMASRLVFADGNPQARLMLVGEAPGAEEDLQGLPFVGPSGRLLDRMLAAIGIDRTNAYVANVIPWRPPGNRTPTPQETAVCLPFIRQQILLADPDVLVCLGGPAAAALLETKQGIMRTRGRWLEFDTGIRRIRAIATLHPAYLLRQPLAKRQAWQDMLAIKKALAEVTNPEPVADE